jgi:hypothetical protein
VTRRGAALRRGVVGAPLAGGRRRLVFLCSLLGLAGSAFGACGSVGIAETAARGLHRATRVEMEADACCEPTATSRPSLGWS